MVVENQSPSEIYNKQKEKVARKMGIDPDEIFCTSHRMSKDKNGNRKFIFVAMNGKLIPEHYNDN
jgi:predicted HAD superfamily Cof-like phosphohydrolase